MRVIPLVLREQHDGRHFKGLLWRLQMKTFGINTMNLKIDS